MGGSCALEVENETFNTLRNQGYHFEHNFGHGKNFPASVFSNLMMLALLIDQIQGMCCELFQQAQEKAERGPVISGTRSGPGLMSVYSPTGKYCTAVSPSVLKRKYPGYLG